MPTSIEQTGTSRTERFFSNVLWNWLGVGVNLFIIIVLSPFTIRMLGAERYGIWMLAFSLIDYYWLMDLGFRSATVKYSAHYRATREPQKINQVINTGLAYAAFAGLFLSTLTFLLSHRIVGFFQVAQENRRVFSSLVIVVGFGWSLGIIFNIFGACLEGFQRFDIASRIWITTNGIRALGCMAVLMAGHGLLAMGVMVVCSQVLGYGLSYLALRRIFPESRLSPRLANVPVMLQMVRYGFHTFVATIAERLLAQTAPLLIGHFRPAAFAGYFALPTRLMQYSADLVERLSLVTVSSASELHANKETDAIARLGIYSNRYSLVIFLPVACILLVYGYDVIRVWINADFARYSAPLLPILVPATALAVAGQFNSGSILYGLGKHGGLARGELVEALVGAACLLWVIPRYEIVGAAWVMAILMLLDRGLFLPWFLCQHLRYSFWAYMHEIYTRPLLVGLPVLGLAAALKAFLLPGRNVLQILAAAVVIGTVYLGLAFWICLERQHKASVLRWAARRSKFLILTHWAARLEA